jgi:hypothetical protein
LGIADAVDILYNTFVVNGDQERVWALGVSGVIRELAKKFLYPCKPSKERHRFGMFRIRIRILSSR